MPNDYVYMLKERFERTECVDYEKNLERQKRAMSERNDYLVLQAVIKNPHISCRQIENEIIFSLSTIALVLSAKDDNDSPYEFGFTIDGQQHRHEKRDERGIVQGEFGFITADGIYHVTVYATDENGNFKILKMRNLRISAPLDGSPLRGEISPEADKYRKQAGLPPLPPVQPPSSPISAPNPLAIPNQITTSKTPPFIFTTQPTVKPACAACGYITTPAPSPGQNGGSTFQFQNPIFNQGDSSKYPQSNIPPYQAVNGPQYTNYQTDDKSKQPPTYPESGYDKFGGVSGSGVVQNSGSPLGNVLGNNNHFGVLPGSDTVQDLGGTVNQFGNIPVSYPSSGDRGTYQQSVFETNNGGINDYGAVNGQNGNVFSQNIPKNPTLSTDVLPPISVSNEVIHVGGGHPQDIPIKDKFPGMQDGLPAGIKEKDITDLLYKFHYTVGFHGHYEKGYKNGAKIGGYFVNGRDGISRVVTYVADENGYRPKVKFINLGLDSNDTPKPDSERTFGLQSFEFVWYPLA